MMAYMVTYAVEIASWPYSFMCAITAITTITGISYPQHTTTTPCDMTKEPHTKPPPPGLAIDGKNIANDARTYR